MSDSARNDSSLRGYYRWHAKFYDVTRWAFLFGRRGLIEAVASQLAAPARILEVGCGTGKNLVALADAFPGAKITGLDLSSDMLDCARVKIAPFADRIELLHRPYDESVADEERKFDLIVISYALSMINPGFDEVIRLCRGDLREGGFIAAVDFTRPAGPGSVNGWASITSAWKARSSPNSMPASKRSSGRSAKATEVSGAT